MYACTYRYMHIQNSLLFPLLLPFPFFYFFQHESRSSTYHMPLP